MAIPTLDEFLSRTTLPNNSYVKEKGFKDLYIRRSKRMVGHTLLNAVDIANVSASRPGNGAFTSLVTKLGRDYPYLVIYVENVLNPRFANKLVSDLGFVEDPRSSHEIAKCYYRVPELLRKVHDENENHNRRVRANPQGRREIRGRKVRHVRDSGDRDGGGG